MVVISTTAAVVLYVPFAQVLAGNPHVLERKVKTYLDDNGQLHSGNNSF